MKSFFQMLGVGLLAGATFSYLVSLVSFGLGFTSSFDIKHPIFPIIRGVLMAILCLFIWLCCGKRTGLSALVSVVISVCIILSLNWYMGAIIVYGYIKWRPLLGDLILNGWCAYLLTTLLGNYVSPLLKTTKASQAAEGTSRGSESQVYQLD